MNLKDKKYYIEKAKEYAGMFLSGMLITAIFMALILYSMS